MLPGHAQEEEKSLRSGKGTTRILWLCSGKGATEKMVVEMVVMEVVVVGVAVSTVVVVVVDMVLVVVLMKLVIIF